MRHCLREPIPEIFESARLLGAALNSHLEGDSAAAARHFIAANTPVVRDWAKSIMGKHRQDILQKRTVSNAPPILPKDKRVAARMPDSGERKALVAKFGYRCCFCGIPLIRKQVRIRAARLYPEAVPWGRTDASRHAAFFAMWMQFDHVLPHARGGDNSFSNLVVTCAPCNFGRMKYTLDELGLADPRAREIIRTNWSGLEELR